MSHPRQLTPRPRRLSPHQKGFLLLLLLANTAVLAVLAGMAYEADAFAPPVAAGAGGLADLPAPTPTSAAAIVQPPSVSSVPAASAAAPAATSIPPTRAPAPTATPISPPVFIALPEAVPGLPEEAQITGLTGRRQTYSLSCESRSAADWAAYFGFAIDELEFLSRLPLSDDPDSGFVGDVHAAWGRIPPEAYGVHAMPVAELLKQYGVKARARRGLTWDAVRAEIAAGQPVIVWVVGHVESGGTRVLYTASNGHTSYVARFEHTVIVTGYTADTVTVVDGARVYTRPLQTFLDAWLPLGNMAVLYVGS